MPCIGIWGLVITLLAVCSQTKAGAGSPTAANPTRLRYPPHSSIFKIVLFTDLHYGEGYDLDAMTDQLQHNILVNQRPNLVVYGGDFVSGFFWDGIEKNWIRSRLRQLTNHTRSLSIPYAFILGNHDDEADVTNRHDILQLIQTIDNHAGLSLTRQGPSWTGGASNYFLDVYRNDNDNNTRAHRLWFFDSGARGCGGVAHGWGCVASSTIAWATKLQQGVLASSPPSSSSLAFVHIPLEEHLHAYHQSLDVVGSKQEPCNCPSVNTDLFQSLLVNHKVGAVWCGHDHGNDFSALYRGVRVGYGRKGGYGGYNGGLYKGARVIELHPGQPTATAPSWIVLSDGVTKVVQDPVPTNIGFRTFLVGMMEKCRSGAPPRCVIHGRVLFLLLLLFSATVAALLHY